MSKTIHMGICPKCGHKITQLIKLNDKKVVARHLIVNGPGKKPLYINFDVEADCSISEHNYFLQLQKTNAELLAALEQAITSMQDSGYPNSHLAVMAGKQAITNANQVMGDKG